MKAKLTPLTTRQVMDHLLPLVPGLTAALDRGINLLQAHCGDAGVARGLAAHFPRSRFAGATHSVEDIALARQLARRDQLGNVWFHQLLPPDSVHAAIYHAALLLDFDASQLDGWSIPPIVAHLRPGGVCLMHLPEADPASRRMLSTLLPAGGLAKITMTEISATPRGLVCVACR